MIDQIPIPDSTPSIWYDKLIQPGLHGVNLIDSKISTPPHASASTIQGTNQYGTFQVRTSRSTEQLI